MQNIENCPFEFQGPLGKNAHAHTPAGPAQRRLPREALTNNLHTLTTTPAQCIENTHTYMYIQSRNQSDSRTCNADHQLSHDSPWPRSIEVCASVNP